MAMFRFTIRDLLWLMVVGALACGWYVHWSAFAAREQELLESMAKHGEASMTGINQNISRMRETFDLQRQFMEEKHKGIKIKMEFSNRLQQELREARRIDAARAKTAASTEQGAAEASSHP